MTLRNVIVSEIDHLVNRYIMYRDELHLGDDVLNELDGFHRGTIQRLCDEYGVSSEYYIDTYKLRRMTKKGGKKNGTQEI